VQMHECQFEPLDLAEPGPLAGGARSGFQLTFELDQAVGSGRLDS
jgi:hypothetical protein